MIINKTNFTILAALFLTFFCLLVSGCAGSKGNEVYQNEISTMSNRVNARKETTPPTLELSASSENNLSEPLKIHWKITNSNQKPIFVYSTLLDKSNFAFAELKIDVSQKLFEILFTSLSKGIVEPNYFPKTVFAEIGAGKSLEGDFNTRFDVLKEINLAKDASKKADLKDSAGQWNVTALIAYGDEIESVQKTIGDTKGGHPIDPIVEWQKIATSKPITIVFK